MSEEVELEFRDWVSKISERLTLILLNIKEGRDLTDNDWEVLEKFFWIYNEGILPFYASKLRLIDENAVSQELFGQNVTSTGNGIQFDYTLSNDKNIEK